MANGYAPYILRDISSVAGSATPQNKLEMHGLLSMLASTQNVNPIIPIGTPNGHKREIRFKYRQPNTVAQTDTSKACDQVLTPAYLESTVSVGNTRSIGWHLPDQLLANYMEEARARVTIPGANPGPVGASAELLSVIYSGANAILKAVNNDLWGLVTAGKNRVTELSTTTTLNLPKDTTVQPVNQGMPKLMSDIAVNGFSGRSQLVGGPGVMFAYMLSQAWKGMDNGGFDSRIPTGMIDYWMDQDFATYSGTPYSADQFYVFEPGSIHLAEYLEYTGPDAGVKPGGSEFFVMPLPVTNNAGQVTGSVSFDAQLKYIDCPTTLTDMYTGVSSTYQKGYALFISKQFGLWQIPSDAYRHEDGRRSVNGALLYTATNNCDTCS